MFQSTYTVSFNNNVPNQALHIEDDQVTFELNARTYSVTTTNGIIIGNQSGGHSGRLKVNNGTVNSSTNIDVGAAANTTGTLIVGANGLISGAPTLNVGKLGTGTLTVQSDGDISSTGSTTIGVGSGITGTATIIGNGTAGSATLFTGTLNVGSTGNGTVNVQLGGLLQNSSTAVIGTGSLFTGTGTGIVNVMGTSSVWNSLGLLEVGDGGSGEVNITLGGTVTGTDNVIGANVSNSGEVNVDGASSLWDNSGTVTVGGLGTGTLNITNQGVVENTAAFIGNANFPSSTGTVAVNGAGSQWINTSGLTVGRAGTGTLNITAGGTVRNGPDGLVGSDPSGTGTVTVDGEGSLWDNSGFLIVGYAGEGTLNITGGGIVRNTAGIVGDQSDGTGHVTVDGDGSLWENSGTLFVGDAGDGTLNITAGGHVTSVSSVGIDSIGSKAGSTGLVTVDGDGSLWESLTFISVGDEGDGTLEITAGGTVQAVFTVIGGEPSGTGHVTVDGDGSLLDNTSGLFVGENGRGTLEITGGGVVQSSDSAISGPAGAPSAVLVNGPGSQLHISGALSVGYSADPITARVGTLDITDGGKVTTDDIAFLGLVEDTTGVVTVAGAGSTWEIGGRLEIGYSSGAGGNTGVGTLRIQPGGTVNVTENTFVSGGDLLSLEGGTLSTSQISFPDGGTADTNFEWTSGTLHVGQFLGDLVNQAGVLAPGNSAGITLINGNYNQLTVVPSS